MDQRACTHLFSTKVEPCMRTEDALGTVNLEMHDVPFSETFTARSAS